ncbi:ATP phosphoribosyltransferase regulatory subunit [Oceanobacillus limi]|uniref:ATP phosphoribosyltransferase regulatory subunit n=1 Tax=Oceanobacillus limi TaxID=930131 RepID=UPI00147B5067|nr:ATP phosphoribosyltransferase regulatory subunit [Oceanobacillus limi]
MKENKLDLNTIAFKQKEKVIDLLKKRFSTYGYQQIQTPAFESYDLYTTVTGTLKQDDMIKVIDRSGRVLVLRPDITIPITQQVAKQTPQLTEELRYFYVSDVFRNTSQQITDYEQLQAGVEFFGNNGSEADAEILALVEHILSDLQVGTFTIEIGHAGFFKEILDHLSLTPEQTNQFKQLVQAKNIAGLQQFINKLNMNESVQNIVEQIPLLYGNPTTVIQRAKELELPANMKRKLETLEEICSLLEAYQCTERIVLDLGLINHMDYYSDVIFQGFIESIGKPILTGGRYNHLADQFGASIPAIGFAFDIDLLLTLEQQEDPYDTQEIAVFYDPSKRKQAANIAQLFRRNGQSVVLCPLEKVNHFHSNVRYKITLKQTKNLLTTATETIEFHTNQELQEQINRLREGA